MKKSIGVFDSGFGGIDILRGIVEELPDYDYIYFGDTAHTPYGTRSKEVVYEFTEQAINFLFENGSELIILACNTASSDALRKVQQEYLPKHHPEKRVLGVLIPAAEEAIKRTTGKRVGVIATEGTVRSGAFERELKKLEPAVEVFQKACPLLVPLVEAGEEDLEIVETILQGYLEPLGESNIDTLILGCTHYGILEDKIRKVIGPDVHIISEASVIPQKLRDYLWRHPEIEEKLMKNGKVSFYSTDLTDKFMSLGSKFFGKEIRVKRVLLS